MEHLYVKNLLLKHILNSLIALIGIGFTITVLPNASAGETNKSSVTNSLIENDSQASFLSPDEAFKLNLTALDTENIQAAFTVAPGHYLYRERIKFEIKTSTKDDSVQIAQITLPAGEIKQDANFGKQEVYHHDFKANIKLNNAGRSEVAIAATYQGCSERGLCYAPIKKTITVALNKKTGSAVNNAASPNNIASSSEDETTTLLKTGNIWP